MTRHFLIGLGVLGSVLALLGALGSQYGLGLMPCQLCIWQRWPHLAAVVIGLGAFGLGMRPAPWLWITSGALAVGTSGAIGVYHTGVEQGWWPGPTTCSGAGGLGNISLEALLDPTIAMPIPVPCNEVAAAFAGLSMASWNALYSFALVGIWLWALRARR